MAVETDSVQNLSTRDDTADQTIDLPPDKLLRPPSTKPSGPGFPPKTLDKKYQFVRELGRGSMGQVFVYYEAGIDREVAIKFQTDSDREQAHRFHTEARIAASLQHPNVVTVLADGKYGDTPYIVFEYLDGKSLDKLSSAMPWTEVRKLGLQLASGLAAVHKKGLLHRDIKPANAMLLERDHQQIVKLIDFGVAKSTEAVNMSGGSTGTPRYMSPEVWDDAAPTERSDVYSLGLTLYQLCTGVKPPIPPYDDDIRLDLPEIDSAFASVVNRCLERDPDNRFASGTELYNALLPLYSVKELLDIDVQQWMRNEQAEAYLWSGRKLARVANVETENLPESHREFLRLSQARVTSAIRRRQILAGLAIVAIIAVYLGIRFSLDRQLDRKVNRHVDKARSQFAIAKQHHDEFIRDRTRAIEKLVTGKDTKAATEEWQKILGLEPQINHKYSGAALELEIAWALDPSRDSVRGLLAQVLEQRARLADELYLTEEREELLERLKVYNKGAYNRWTLPGRVQVTTEPAGSSVSIARYVTDSNGAMRTEPVADGLITPFTQNLPPGSYIFLFAADGEHPEVRYPVLIRHRTPAIELAITRPTYRHIPEGFVYVAGGSSYFGHGARRQDEQLREFFVAVPVHKVAVETFLIARHETTFRDWLRFLAAVCKVPGCADQPDLIPKGEFDVISLKLDWVPTTPVATDVPVGGAPPAEGLGRWRYTHKTSPGPAIVALEGQLIEQPGARAHGKDWRDFPVGGIGPTAVLAYLRWLRTSGNVPGARLCTDREWERAARGADMRTFPHGDQLLPGEANFNPPHGDGTSDHSPSVVGSYEASVSPFGVYDMAGNVWEFSRSIYDEGKTGDGKTGDTQTSDTLMAIRGGCYYQEPVSAKVQNRWTAPGSGVSVVGLRVCSDFASK